MVTTQDTIAVSVGWCRVWLIIVIRITILSQDTIAVSVTLQGFRVYHNGYNYNDIDTNNDSASIGGDWVR